MRKAFLTIVGAVSLATAAIATPTKVEARCYGCWVGGAFAAGLIGGSIIATNRAYGYGYYGYGPGYGGYAPTYYAPPVYGYGYAPYYGYAPRYYYPRRHYGYGYGYRPYRAYYGGRHYAPRRYGYHRRW